MKDLLAKLPPLEAFALHSMQTLAAQDPEIYQLVQDEWERLHSTIPLVAAENWCSPASLGTLGSVLSINTCEGFPGRRYHAGAEVIDRIERLAIERAKAVFGAEYANVQPHSASQANQIALMTLCPVGGRIMGLGLDVGGHLSHGAPPNWSAHVFDSQPYELCSESLRLDYEQIRSRALEFRPHVLICGASSYPRALDFARFRAIADEVGAFLLADISHIAGLVAAGEHPSPVPHAHIVTTSTYKPGGPRGGLILVGEDRRLPRQPRALSAQLQRWTFPGIQGTPAFNNIAGKAVLFAEMQQSEYKRRQTQIVHNAKALASGLEEAGYQLVTGGTDNHLLLVDLRDKGITGKQAQEWLESCGILTNKNQLPFDERNATHTSGLRLGTPMVTGLGMKEAEMSLLVQWLDSALTQVINAVQFSTSPEKCWADALREEIHLWRKQSFPGLGA